MQILDSVISSKLKVKNDKYNRKPLVSLVIPAYNEADIVEKNLKEICNYMVSLEDEYQWEIVFINDGSNDDTGQIAEAFASSRKNVHTYHHVINLRVGHALKNAFQKCRGDYIVTLDLDLSYSTEHIEKLLNKIQETKAKIVITSPYMKGGKVSNVPWLRKKLSVWANRFLSYISKANLHTLTSMVRAYDREFLSSLDLRSTDMEINLEIIYKTMLLRGRIEEIPAHLNWGFQKNGSTKRKSSFRIARGIIQYILSGFTFRPFMFFIVPGFALMILSTYTLIWVLIHVISAYMMVPDIYNSFDATFSVAVANAFRKSPHSFFVGGISLIVSIQLISLGIISFQNKRYFEDMFHLCTNIYRNNQ